MKSKIVFFGSDQYSEIVLRILKDSARFETTQAPPPKANVQEIIEHLKITSPDIGVLASYGKILPKKILAIPKHGILNIHPSMLPEYRGPTPVPMAILNGEQATGVSIIKMDEKVDHGPILAQFKIEIYPEDSSEKLLNKCFLAGGKVLATVLPSYLEGQVETREQDHSKATFTPKLNREDGYVPTEILKLALEGKRLQGSKASRQKGGQEKWPNKKLCPAPLHLCTPAPFLDRFIRAMHPWPVSFTEVQINGSAKRLKILQAHQENEKLVLDQVQLEGKNPVTWKQFCEGYPKTGLSRLVNR